MTGITQATVRNLVLRRLEPQVFAALAPHLAPVTLVKRDPLAAAGLPIERAYFLGTGIASVVAVTPSGAQAEVGMIGREGFVHPSLALGTALSQFDIFIQANADGLAMPSATLVTLADAHPSLRRVLLDYVQVMLVQISHTAVATASLTLRERLARWLMMSHDRVDGDEVPMTHEFLSLLLTVRRPGVTEAMQSLEGTGAIKARRGVVIIRDRDQLRELAGGAYGGPEAEYQRLLPG